MFIQGVGHHRLLRMQLVTIAELLAGKGIDFPAKKAKSNVTFQAGPKPKRSGKTSPDPAGPRRLTELRSRGALPIADDKLAVTGARLVARG